MITASQRLYIRPESDHKPLPFPSRPLGPETSSHPRKHHDSPHASVAHPGAFLPLSSSPSPVLRLPVRLSRSAHPRPPLRRPHLQLHPNSSPPSIASPIRALFFLPDENACSSERHRDAGHVMPARPPESEPALACPACPHRRGPDNSLPDHPSPIHHVANLLPSPQARATRSSLILLHNPMHTLSYIPALARRA